MKDFKKTTLNWLAALASVWVVASMSAAPVLAAVVAAANSVNSRAIINGQVKTADLGKGAVTAKKIKAGAVNSAKIADGTITNADIAAGAAIAASKINRSGFNADLLDGQHASAFSPTSHTHDAGSIVSGILAAARLPVDGYNGTYFTEAESDSRFINATGNETMTGNLTAGNFTYGAVQTAYVTVPASSLVPLDSAYGYTKSLDGNLNATGTVWTDFTAPVYLPQGAVVTELSFLFLDNHLSFDAYAYLARSTHTAAYETVAYLQPDGTDPAWRTATAPPSWGLGTINNNTYSYYVLVTLHGLAGADTKAGKIKITYQYTTPRH